MENKYNTLEERIKLFKEITDLMVETYSKKSKDYGPDSLDFLYAVKGFDYYLQRDLEKLLRLDSINASGEVKVEDETIIDSLLDKAVMAIIAIIQFKRGKAHLNKNNTTIVSEIKKLLNNGN